MYTLYFCPVPVDIEKLNLSSLYGESGAFQTVGNWVGLIAFVLLLSTLFHFTKGKKTIEVDAKEK